MTSTGNARQRLRRAWRLYRDWRRSRPFWSGITLLLAGLIILAPPYATLRVSNLVISISTLGGVSSLLIGVLLICAAVSLWIRPQFRLAAGISAVLLGLLALATANLGGFLAGTLLALVGGALAMSWGEKTAPRRRPRATDEAETPSDETENVTIPRRRASGSGGVTVVALLATTALTLVGAAGSRAEAAPLASQAPADPPEGRAWVLKASKLEMSELRFGGIVDTVLNGQTIKVLKFTAGTLKITGLVQTADAGGRTLTVAAPPGSVSTISDGSIELLTQRLQGKFQLGPIPIPMDLSPASPPPLVPPSVTYTDVTVNNTDLQGGILSIPGARITLS